MKVKNFSDGLAAMEGDRDKGLQGSWGYIDKTGNIILPLKYLSVKSFDHGLGMADGIYVDKEGKIYVQYINK